MRAIALLLIIANLLYFGWATLIDAPPELPLSDSSSNADVPKLVLASERPVPPETKTTQLPSKPAAEVAQSSPQKCVSVGPFQDLPSAVEASATLKGAGYDSRQRLAQGELWVGHWVSIGGFATHEQAERAVETLKEKGVADAYILPGVDPANVISLGIFKENDRAQRRLNEAKNLGFNAQVADRTRAGSVYWIDVDFKNDEHTLDTSILGSKPGKIVRLETRPCAPAEG